MTTGAHDSLRAELHELVADLGAWVAWERSQGAQALPQEAPLSAEALAEIRGLTPAPASRQPAPARGPRQPDPAGYRPPAVRIEPARPAPAPPRAAPAAPRRPTPSAPPAPAPSPASLGAWGRLAAPPAAAPSAGRSALQDAGDLGAVRRVLGDCTRCPLHAGRRSIVFGVGSADARLMIIGEGPGANEDRQGEPFVGKAGQMLDRMLQNVLGLARTDVYISNVVKCRPPGNRNPEADEIARCMPFLRAQLKAVAPEVVLVLGSVASRAVFQTSSGVTRLRGHWRELAWDGGRARAMPTFHPAYLLRNPADKRKTFEDLLLVKQALASAGQG